MMIVFDGQSRMAFAPPPPRIGWLNREDARGGAPYGYIKFNLFSRLTPERQENTVALTTAGRQKKAAARMHQLCLSEYSRSLQRRKA